MILWTVYIVLKPAPEQRLYPERIPVRFWHMWTAEWKVVIDDIVAAYNESQGKYEVIALSIPSNSAGGSYTQNASQKVLLAIAGGNPPDVMAQWNPVLPSWAEKELIAPLDEIITPEEEAHIRETAFPIALKIGSYKDRLYAISAGLNAYACYYRPSHFVDAGLDPSRFPETLDDFWEQSIALSKYREDKRLSRLGFAGERFELFISVFGGDLHDKDMNAIDFDTPGLLKAMEFVYDTNGYYGFDEMIRFRSGVNRTSAGGSWPFISGQYSIALDGQWRVEQIARYAPEMDYDTAPMPPPDGGRELAGFSNGNFLVIPSGADEPEGAWDFIKFWSGVSDPERAAEFYTWGGWLPMNQETADAPAFREYVKRYPQFQTFLDMLPSENLQPIPPLTYQVFIGQMFQDMNEILTRGSKSPEDTLEFFKEKVNIELDRRERLGQ